MIRSSLSFLLLFVVIACVGGDASFSRGLTHSPHVFGVPRAGGLFGGKKDSAAESKDGPSGGTMYPAMTQDEVEEWLGHIPVFAVTDEKGQFITLKPDGDAHVTFFFLSPLMANATLNQLKGTTPMELRIAAYPLGKVWFGLLHGDKDKEIMLKPPGNDTTAEPTKGFEARLIADTRDLLGARMLLTMTPEDGEKLKDGQPMTQEIAQEAIKKAMTQSPKFNATYNEIPVFNIGQMRMQKPLEEGETGQPLTLFPMYFSLQNMVNTWQNFMSQASAEMPKEEPAIGVMDLFDMVQLMMKESEIDFRNVVLVPATPVSANREGAAEEAMAQASADPMSSMGGSTLGDL